MLEEWRDLCLSWCVHPPTLYSGSRKILRNKRTTFRLIKDDLKIEDCGFTKSKLTMLKRLYFHEESHAKAVEMWRGRCARRKYGSVSFHCYNHLVKGGDLDTKRSKRASVMGPCVQSVCLTWVRKGVVSVDIFYRTTEVLKKFPADLVFIRDVLLPPFNLEGEVTLTFHFANVTVHPMYFITLIPLLDDPVAEIEKFRHKDPVFYRWTVKWTARYLCPEHGRGIAKFAQSVRTRDDGLRRIDKKVLPALQKYLRDNHPGHRNEYNDPEGDDE